MPTAVDIGENVSLPSIALEGAVTAQVTTVDRENQPEGDPRPEAVAIDIGQTSTVNSLVNDAVISASVFGFTDLGPDENDPSDNFIVAIGDAYAIRDASGTLTQVENAGSIIAQSAETEEEGQEGSVAAVALDLSQATSDIVFTQLRRETGSDR